MKKINIGGSDFESIIRNDYLYVDKTLMIKELLDSASSALLFTRPRRFGKSLNMSMLKAFFEINPSTRDLFQNLNIWKCGEQYRQEQGKYPVIYLSFYDFTEPDWEQALDYLKAAIANEYTRHENILSGDKLKTIEKENYRKIQERTSSIIDFKRSLKDLSKWLFDFYGVKPVILIDEYDKPAQKAQTSGYYTEMIDFLKGFYTGGLKDNPFLTKGILTGVLRLAKENIFTGMNNFDVYSIFSEKYSCYFGFTQNEVNELAEYYGAEQDKKQLKDWYDGYNFGGYELYNPWSVLQYFSQGRKARAYWLQTSGNDIIHSMFRNIDSETLENLRKLYNGQSITVPIHSTVAYSDLDEYGELLYTILLMTGYLKTIPGNSTGYGQGDDGMEDLFYECELTIPNHEIRRVYANEILQYFSLYCSLGIKHSIVNALRDCDTKTLQKELSRFLLQSTSHFDKTYEVFYHGLLLGMTAMMDDSYYISSNKEAGYGRYDIGLEPRKKGLPGIVIELKSCKDNFKSADERDSALLQEALHALEQIKENQYFNDFQMRNIDKTILYGMAFCGKHVRVESEYFPLES